MASHILRCAKCFTYTLEENCPKCKSLCQSTKPAKFSPIDKYGYWRRLAKHDMED